MTDACSNLTDACSELILLAPLLLLIILFFQAMNKSYLMCCWFERSLRLRVHFCVDQVLEKKKLQSQAKSRVASCCVRFLRENIAEMSFSITTWRAEKEICFLLYKVASSYFFLGFFTAITWRVPRLLAMPMNCHDTEFWLFLFWIKIKFYIVFSPCNLVCLDRFPKLQGCDTQIEGLLLENKLCLSH